MGIFDGKDGDFIRNNASDNVLLEFMSGNISKRKAYAIVKGAPDNKNAQNAALSKADTKSADELQVFASILDKRFSPKEKTGL